MTSPLSVFRPGPTGEDHALLRFLFGGIRQNDAAGRRLRLLDALDDEPIAERFEIDFGCGWGHGFRSFSRL